MSLEEALNKNTAALERHNELLEKVLSAGGQKTSTSGAAPVTQTEPARDNKAETATAPARGRRAAAAPKAPTVAVVSEKTKEFLEVDDQDEYQARREFVKKVVAKFNVEKMSLLAEADRQPALDMLVAFAAGDDPGLDEPNADDDLT